MKINLSLTLLLTSSAALPLVPGFAQPIVPAQSEMGRAAGLQQVLVSPLEADSGVGKGGWMLKNLSMQAAPPSVVPKLGQSALTLGAEAEAAGAKGDFTLSGAVPGEAKFLGMWVFLTPDPNVERLGFQIQDAEGEYLLATVAADWQGWKWVEFDLASASFAQAYAQTDKNKKVDSPLRSVHAAWFAKAAGPSSLTIDALVASTELKQAPTSLDVQVSGAGTGEPNQPMTTQQIVLTNFAAQARTAQVDYSVQRDPALFSDAPPDPVWGLDLALGAKSWSEAEGKRLEDASLTDGKDWTNATLPWGSHKEATQTVDLGAEHLISHLSYVAGDANWAWKVDVSASSDGKTYVPVAGLQNVDTHGKWGAQVLEVAQPFRAHFLRLRHHNGGAEVNQISMPSSFSVYEGVGAEKWLLPSVGETVSKGTLSQSIAPRSFGTLSIRGDKPLTPGAYFIAARVREGARTQLIYRHFLVMPAPLREISPASRFGLNTADYTFAPWHRRLGIGWVRFENMKWPMISPAPNTYSFHGVAPWNLDHDAIVSAFRAQNISFLPYLFQTPDYASSAPADSKRKDAYPPRDNAQMADFVFQTVARYGSKKHPDAELKTADKKSGLNQISTYEIWNEPNLHDPGWSGWVGTNAQYNDLLRASAQAVKRADPSARVTNGGTGGIDVAIVNSLLAPFADGKKPLDFIDVLNVHFYSGRTAPELSTNDPNANRSGNAAGARTYEDDLHRLISWRDKNKPGLPIWLTETGYDSAGPFGTNEAHQAAQLPRDIMLALASGIEKVFVFRDQGSSPSMFAASGVIRDDGSYKPSWFTYATLIRELDGIQTGGLRLPYADPNVRLYAFKRGTETILSAWTIDGTGSLNLKLGQSTITDAFGSVRQSNIAGALPLSMYPIYIKNIGDAEALQVLVGRAQRGQNARKAEQVRLAQLRAYLFDFGSREDVGTIDIGDTRTFTSVLGTDVYDEAKGFGFFPGAAGPDNSMHWISDPLDKDSTRMNPDHTFRLHAKPGHYQLRAHINPQGPANLTIKGALGGDKIIPITHDGPVISADIEVGAEPLSISNNGYGDLFWLSLVEQPGA